MNTSLKKLGIHYKSGCGYSIVKDRYWTMSWPLFLWTMSWTLSI